MWAATGIMGRVRKRPCLVARGGTAALTQGGVWAVRPVESPGTRLQRRTGYELPVGRKKQRRGGGGEKTLSSRPRESGVRNKTNN